MTTRISKRSASLTPLSVVATIAVFIFAVSPGTAEISERPDDFGKQWVRQNPFTLYGLALQNTKFDIERYREAGFTSVFPFKPRLPILEAAVDSGMTWHGHLYAKKGPTEEVQNAFNHLTETYPGSIACLVNDEPTLAGMPATAEAIAWLHNAYPDMLAYSNAFPMGGDGWHYAGSPLRTDYTYQQYIDDFINIIRPDVMMFDIYPFQDRDGVANIYFHNMQMVREASLKAGIPYWVFVQTYKSTNRRVSSDSDYRMQVFSSLAFGYTGIALFTFDTAHEVGLLDINGDPTSMFPHVVETNKEVMNIAGALRFLTSTEVRFVKRTHASPVPQGMMIWDNFSVPQTYIEDISIAAVSHTAAASVDQEDQPEQQRTSGGGDQILMNGTSPDSYVDASYADGLIGYFRDDLGGNYFMITNLWHNMDATAEQRELSFTIKFKSSVKQIARLSRASGSVELPPLENGEITLTLPGGTGDLFKINDAEFPGLSE